VLPVAEEDHGKRLLQAHISGHVREYVIVCRSWLSNIY
jgi:hypothetical protein